MSSVSPSVVKPARNYGHLPVVPPMQPQGKTDLGNNSKFSSPSDLPGVKTAKKPGRYTLQRMAKELLPDAQVAWCSTRSVGNGEGVKVNYHDQKRKASFGNLHTCSSVWTCPVCSPRIMSERGEVLERVVSKHRAAGGGVLLVTLTLRHHVGDDLAGLIDALNKAWSRTKSGKAWQNFKCRIGHSGNVNALEVTWGKSAGWHPHKHVLLLLDFQPSEDEITEIRGWLSSQFIAKAEKLGCYVSASWGVKVQGYQGAASYISKWGKELTSSDTKTGENITPFGLLELYHQGDEKAGWLFQEYAFAIKGKKRLFWSHNLKDAREEAQAEIDAEKEAEEKPRTVLNLHSSQFDVIRLLGKRDEILTIAERTKGDYRAIWRWLETECGLKYDKDLETQLLEAEALNCGIDVQAIRRERMQARFIAQMEALNERMLLYYGEDCIEKGKYTEQ